jgi:pimeloyl-ACP methyl ester carboxylesterase
MIPSPPAAWPSRRPSASRSSSRPRSASATRSTATSASALPPQSNAVRSVIFLAGSFKHPGRPGALDTRYERNLEAMLQAVAQQPALADRLRVVLAQAVAGGQDLERLDGHDLAARALTGVPPALAHQARHPFRDSAALVTYAQQHLEFWSHDELGAPASLRVPALGMIGEHDQIISAAGLRAALEAFAVSGFEGIPGATHYSFYERPDAIAEAIEQWTETWNDANDDANEDALAPTSARSALG